jgi:hypothetical protein
MLYTLNLQEAPTASKKDPHPKIKSAATWLSILNLLGELAMSIIMIMRVLDLFKDKDKDIWEKILYTAITGLLPVWMCIDALICWISCMGEGVHKSTLNYFAFKEVLYGLSAVGLLAYAVFGYFYKYQYTKDCFQIVVFMIIPQFLMYGFAHFAYGVVSRHKNQTRTIWVGVLQLLFVFTVVAFLVLALEERIHAKQVDIAEIGLIIAVFVDVPFWTSIEVIMMFYGCYDYANWVKVKDYLVNGLYRQFFTYLAICFFLNFSPAYPIIFMVFPICHFGTYFALQIIFLNIFDSHIPKKEEIEQAPEIPARLIDSKLNYEMKSMQPMPVYLLSSHK